MIQKTLKQIQSDLLKTYLFGNNFNRMAKLQLIIPLIKKKQTK